MKTAGGGRLFAYSDNPAAGGRGKGAQDDVNWTCQPQERRRQEADENLLGRFADEQFLLEARRAGKGRPGPGPPAPARKQKRRPVVASGACLRFRRDQAHK